MKPDHSSRLAQQKPHFVRRSQRKQDIVRSNPRSTRDTRVFRSHKRARVLTFVWRDTLVFLFSRLRRKWPVTNADTNFFSLRRMLVIWTEIGKEEETERNWSLFNQAWKLERNILFQPLDFFVLGIILFNVSSNLLLVYYCFIHKHQQVNILNNIIQR